MTNKRKILIIDDEAGFTRMVRLILEKTGAYEVREENDALQSLPVARAFKPDLILLDVVMPGNDGGDVAAKIKADATLKDTPVVFLTAIVPKREAGTDGLVSGGMVFLAKPVSMKALVTCIETNARTATGAPCKPVA